jgi:FtsZ-binding cell division protein ZapB
MQKEVIYRMLELKTENQDLAKAVAGLEAASESLARENNALKEQVAHLEAEVTRYRAATPPVAVNT